MYIHTKKRSTVNKFRSLSYKQQLSIYSGVIIIIMVTISILYNITNTQLINRYNNVFEIYEDLNAFYDIQGEAHDSFKNYLYTQSPKDLETYEERMKEASTIIQEIGDEFVNAEMLWRFDLLSNMLDSYEEQAEKVKTFVQIKDDAYQSAYANLLEINEMIIKTSDDYYRIAANEIAHTRQTINQEESMVYGLSIVIVCISVMGIVVYTRMIFKNITNPIHRIVNNIKEIKHGSYDLSEISSISNEMNVLCIALHDLADMIQTNLITEKEKAILENRLLEKENENLKKDEIAAVNELKVLQNQINPHFLFNTVNLIYQKANEENADQTVSLIEKMSECLRYTLGQSARVSTLETEIEFVRNYIYMQNQRFQNRIVFELHIDEPLTNIKIPGMIIEPIIDNSIKHGLNMTLQDGLVSIYITQRDNFIHISVSDNGVGMSNEALEALIMNDYRMEDGDENIGLHNLSRRLHMFFSNKVILSVNSCEDCGFETMMSLPIET